MSFISFQVSAIRCKCNCFYNNVKTIISLFYSDCLAVLEAGNATSGVYDIQPGENKISAQCDMVTDGGGWTVSSMNLNIERCT